MVNGLVTKHEELPEGIHDLIASVATVVTRRFRAHVERADVIQEAYAWAMPKVEWLREQLLEENKEKLVQNEKRIAWQMKRACERYARKEKAVKSGYQINDEAFYETYSIAQLLAFVIKAIETVTPFEQGQVMVDDGQPKKPSAPAESGNLIAMLVDIKKAYLKLEHDERKILAQRYYEELTLEQMAGFWECSASTADRRCEKALKKLQDLLGGETPWS